MSQDPSSMYLSVIISGNQAFEILFICVIYLSHSVYIQFSVHPEKKLPTSLLHRCYNIYGSSRRLAEHPGECGLQPARSVDTQGNSQRGSVDERVYIYLPTLRIGWSRQPPASLILLCSIESEQSHQSTQPSLNHIKVLKLTSLTR